MSEKLNHIHRAPLEGPLFFRLADRLGWSRDTVACVMCELFCTFILMYGGLSINAVETIQTQTSNQENFHYGVALSWGVWLLLTGYIGSQLSGPHCNPAFSLMHYIIGTISWQRMVLYCTVQFIACYFGSLLVFIVYYDGINAYDHGVRQVHGNESTAGIFATYPRDYLSVWGGLIDQFLTTGLLAICALAFSDERNRVPKLAQPGLMGIALWGMVSTFSQNCGAALNPARDLGPRLMTLTVGYGWEVFSYNSYKWFWIPIVGPTLGATAGAYIYKFGLADYLPQLDDKPQSHENRAIDSDEESGAAIPIKTDVGYGGAQTGRAGSWNNLERTASAAQRRVSAQ